MAKRLVSANLLAPAILAFSGNACADLVVLQYHHVSDATPASTSTSTSLFAAQLDLISEMDLSVVPLESATREALAGEAENKQLVAITFDDAYESVYRNARPLLESRGVPYTVFVNTDAVGGQGYMTWEQLAEISSKEHVTLANHSTDHGHLARKPGESQDRWSERIAYSLDDAAEELQQRIGSGTPLFAYPYGEFDKGLLHAVQERGWYGYGQQSGAIGKGSDPTRLPRFPMANAYGQLGSLKDKLLSKAFPIDGSQLPDGVIEDNPPVLTFTLPDGFTVSRLTCFGSGMGQIEISETGDGAVSVEAPEPFNSRRFRYNCTYPSGNGQYYWMSQQWLDLDQPED